MHTLLWYIVLSMISNFLSEISRNPSNGRRRNFENFFFFFLTTLTEMPPAIFKICAKKFMKNL